MPYLKNKIFAIIAELFLIVLSIYSVYKSPDEVIPITLIAITGFLAIVYIEHKNVDSLLENDAEVDAQKNVKAMSGLSTIEKICITRDLPLSLGTSIAQKFGGEGWATKLLVMSTEKYSLLIIQNGENKQSAFIVTGAKFNPDKHFWYDSSGNPVEGKIICARKEENNEDAGSEK